MEKGPELQLWGVGKLPWFVQPGEDWGFLMEPYSFLVRAVEGQVLASVLRSDSDRTEGNLAETTEPEPQCLCFIVRNTTGGFSWGRMCGYTQDHISSHVLADGTWPCLLHGHDLHAAAGWGKLRSCSPCCCGSVVCCRKERPWPVTVLRQAVSMLSSPSRKLSQSYSWLSHTSRWHRHRLQLWSWQLPEFLPHGGSMGPEWPCTSHVYWLKGTLWALAAWATQDQRNINDARGWALRTAPGSPIR